MKKDIIETDQAPAAIGTYSQAVRVGNTVYCSGQIPLDPESMQVVSETFEEQVMQVFKNLQAVAQAAGGDLSDIVKLTIYLIDMAQFTIVNEVMSQFFAKPYPARAAIGVKSLPKNVQVEMDAIMVTL